MEYIKYGNAGIEVSRICLGAMTFPNTMEEQEASDLVRRCYDRGCNFIDTADSYRGSEEFLGKALKGIREDLILSTKVYASHYNDRRRGANGSRHHIVNALHSSLRKLQTDYIDIYMCHHPDPLTPFEETYSTLDNFVKQGKIRYIAMCNSYAWQVAYALGVCAKNGWEPPVSVQISYNLLDRISEVETVPMAERFNLMLQSYGPQARGLLAGKFTRETGFPDEMCQRLNRHIRERCGDDLFELLDVMKELCDKYNITMGQLSTAWILHRSPQFIPLVGGSKAEHLDPLMDVTEIKLEATDVDRLTEMTTDYVYLRWTNQPNYMAPARADNRI